MSDPFHIVLRRLRDAADADRSLTRRTEFVEVRRRDLIALLEDFERIDTILRSGPPQTSSQSGES